MRVASLLPSATEIVCAVGGRGDLVGVSHQCDHPPDVRELPILTRSRLPQHGNSAEIVRAARSLVRDALAVHDVDEVLLARVAPDVILTQDLCQVCAVSFEAVERAVADVLGGRVISVVRLHPRSLAEVFDDVRAVAQAIGRADAGASLADELERRARAIGARAPATRPKVLTIEWIDPVMIGGLWMPDLIALAGGEPLVTKPGQLAPVLDREHLAPLDPDVVVIKPCGFGLERTLAERETLRRALPWERWRAVREGRVFIADGHALFNRPGPRLVESLEVLAACVHPEVFGVEAARHAGWALRIDEGLAVHQL